MPPPKKPAPPLRLEFTTNSLRNTTIAVDNDQTYYEIVTRYWHPNTTKINKLDVESREFKTIAEIERVPGKSKEPKVRFRKAISTPAKEKEPEGGDEVMGEWIKASDFLQFDPLKPGGTVASENAQYRWKTHKRMFRLVKADDEEQTPLVVYHPYRRHFFVFRMSQHAWLEVKPDTDTVQALDKLIVSYLLVERRRRDAKLRLKLEHSV